MTETLDFENMDGVKLLAFLIGLCIGVGVRCLVYTALVWVMVKVQGLNYTLWGLLGSTLAATVAAHIPFVGPFVSYIVLLICLHKVTGESIFPDIVFTVAISGALMFCINLWLLAAIMPDLRPAVKAAVPAHAAEAAPAAPAEEKPQKAAPSRPLLSSRKAATRSEDNGFVLKGITLRGSRSMAMVSHGRQIYSVEAGETFNVETSKGLLEVRCDAITRASVTLSFGTDKTVELTLP